MANQYGIHLVGYKRPIYVYGNWKSLAEFRGFLMQNPLSVPLSIAASNQTIVVGRDQIIAICGPNNSEVLDMMGRY